MNTMNFVSILISICALTLTAYGLYATRHHNKLSVTPDLSTCTNKTTMDQGYLISVDLMNHGIGPAKITDFILYKNDKAVPKAGGKYFETIIREHLGNSRNYRINFSYDFGKSASMRAGTTQRLIEVFFPNAKTDEADQIIKELEAIGCKILYKSFYGQKFCYDLSA